MTSCHFHCPFQYICTLPDKQGMLKNGIPFLFLLCAMCSTLAISKKAISKLSSILAHNVLEVWLLHLCTHLFCDWQKVASLRLLVHMWCPNGSHSCLLPGPAAGRRIFFPDSSSCRDHDIFQPFHRVSCKMLSYSCLSYWQLKPSRGWQPYILPQLPSRIHCWSYFSSA